MSVRTMSPPSSPLFIKRCDSMLAYINLVGRVNPDNIHSDDVTQLVKLVNDGKIGVGTGKDFGYYISLNAQPYLSVSSEITDPTVFFLASQSPENAERIQIYRKNWKAPAIPKDVVLTEEVVNVE